MSRRRGPASALLPGPPTGLGRTVTVASVDAPAVVLGSTQPQSLVDAGRAGAAGVAVVRRRSGGGAVMVEPGALVWVDVTLARHDPLWDDDVGRSFAWLGRAWAAALADVGADRPVVHAGAPVATGWSARVCFAGLGPGEVTVAGAKVVGLCQRRDRFGARFQCAALLGWDPAPLLDLLALSGAERESGRAELVAVAAGIAVAAGDLVAALLAHLP